MLKLTVAERAPIKTLLAALLALQTFFLVGIITVGAVGDFSEERAGAAEDATAAANKAATLLSEAVTEAREALAGEAILPGYGDVFAAPESCTLTAGGSGIFLGGALQIMRPDGTVACTSLRQGAIDGPGYAGAPWLRRLVTESEPFVVGPVVDPVTKVRAVIIAAPIADPGGALVLSLDLGSLGRGLDRQFGRDVLSPAFVVVTPDRSLEIARSPRATAIRFAGSRFSEAVPFPGATLFGLDGVERIFAEGQVPDLGWHVYAGISESAVLASAYKELATRIGLGLASLVVVVMAGLAVNRRIVKPIRALTAAVEAASEGDLTLSVPEEGPAELSRLGARFNHMLEIRARAEKTLEQSLAAQQSAANRLEELAGMKNAFIMAISHELRTPLTVVAGYSALLEDESKKLSEDEKDDCIHRIGVASRRLEQLLLDLLDVERLSRGVIEANRRPTDMHVLVRNVLSGINGGDQVEMKVKDGLRANVDAALVERIIENLVGNAIKHTPKGTKISVHANRRGSELKLRVDDAGPGIPDGMKESIFEPFRQSGVPDHAPGTGVGLNLVSEFARVHGGRAWVQDRRGGGASFRVILSLDEHETTTRLAA